MSGPGGGSAWRGFGGSVAALRQKVDFLARPESYAETSSHVEALETHMAWVFLTDRHAYKLKKPIRSTVLDYSTPAKRRGNLVAELHLNRRLAPGVYRRVLPLMENAEGSLGFEGGDGARIVDWVLQMRRLPTDRTLSTAIREGVASLEMADRLAEALLGFYRKAEGVELCPAAYLERIRRELELSRETLRTVPSLAGPVGRSGAKLQRYLESQGELVGARASHLVDGHGDLRPEHVYFEGQPVVIDCLEFNRRLRTVDPVDELCYLAIECELLGADWFGVRVLGRYICGMADPAPPDLIRFYKGCRAMLRARLALVHAARPGRHSAEHWHALAQHYVELAERATAALE